MAHLADIFLQPTDGVAISFWIISIAMIAATVFFYAEARTVNDHWKTSSHVGVAWRGVAWCGVAWRGGLVTLVAGVHYMREYLVQVHQSLIIYQYIDWSITVPLQMNELHLILKPVDQQPPPDSSSS